MSLEISSFVASIFGNTPSPGFLGFLLNFYLDSHRNSSGAETSRKPGIQDSGISIEFAGTCQKEFIRVFLNTESPEFPIPQLQRVPSRPKARLMPKIQESGRFYVSLRV